MEEDSGANNKSGQHGVVGKMLFCDVTQLVRIWGSRDEVREKVGYRDAVSVFKH